MNWFNHLSDAERRLAAWLRWCLTNDRTADSVPASFISRWQVDEQITELGLPQAATVAKFVHLGLIADDFPDVCVSGGKRIPLACSDYKILGAVLCLPTAESGPEIEELATTPTPEERALAYILANPDCSRESVAIAAGIHPKTLYKPAWKRVRAAMLAAKPGRLIPRGYVDKNGNLEAGGRELPPDEMVADDE
jgi:hypothetical protein